MAVPVILPKMEMSQENATITEWLTVEGETVRKGQPLLMVETDKVSVEIESPADGILAGIRFGAQETVPVTTVIAQILAPGEELGAVEDPDGQAVSLKTQEFALPADDRVVTPVARRMATELGVDLNAVSGSGPGGRVVKADVEAAASATGPRGLRASPAARRLARAGGIDLAAVPGSGPRGRVQAADVQALLAQSTAESPADELIPFAGMRATIARRMTESYQRAPHIHLRATADVSAVEATRRRLSELGDEKITFTVMLVKVCAWALCHHPRVNATVTDAGMQLCADVNVGVAVSLPEGLIVPVIRQADQRSLSDLARALNDLTVRARAGTLTPADVADGSFTLTNLGMFGVESFDPILNPPQAAILGVGAPVRTATEVGDQVVFRPRVQLTLGADHRALDGAIAAQFLADLVAALEQPELMLL
ncbi:MAG: 2-oxo acid dehydrogenase subunit E2 [Anaerolineales bacterium]|nr:2-oxo acid dehydrogenase subunit E2 [Anaerolineales bacterium]HRX02649.1 dihydrolipoamide acetyltransferase family protein [Anaerolineae bacterium]